MVMLSDSQGFSGSTFVPGGDILSRTFADRLCGAPSTMEITSGSKSANAHICATHRSTCFCRCWPSLSEELFGGHETDSCRRPDSQKMVFLAGVAGAAAVLVHGAAAAA